MTPADTEPAGATPHPSDARVPLHVAGYPITMYPPRPGGLQLPNGGVVRRASTRW